MHSDLTPAVKQDTPFYNWPKQSTGTKKNIKQQDEDIAEIEEANLQKWALEEEEERRKRAAQTSPPPVA